MHLSASTTARQLQELQATATTPVLLITFTDTERTVSVRDKSGKRIIRISGKTNRLNCSQLMGFRSNWATRTA